MLLGFHKARFAAKSFRRACCGDEDLEMQELVGDGRLNVSQADHFFPPERCLKNAVVFLGDDTIRLLHPVSQIDSMVLSLQSMLLTDHPLQLRYHNIRIAYLLHHFFRFYLLILWLHFELHADIPLYRNLPMLDPKFHHLLIQSQRIQSFSVMIDVVKPITIHTKFELSITFETDVSALKKSLPIS